MIKDDDYANNGYIQYTDSFLLRCVPFFSRHLDNNQLENLTSGIFDHQRYLFEL